MQISIRGGGEWSTQLGREVSPSIRGLIPASILTHTYKNMHLCTKVPSTQAKMSNSVFFFSPHQGLERPTHSQCIKLSHLINTWGLFFHLRDRQQPDSRCVPQSRGAQEINFRYAELAWERSIPTKKRRKTQ